MGLVLTVALWVGGVVVAVGVLVLAIRAFAQPDGTMAGGGAGGALGGFDEAFNPAQHNANLERERQRSVPVESPVPGNRQWESDEMKIHYSIDGTPQSISIRGNSTGKSAAGDGSSDTSGS
ncbi:hypothetical protein [Rarobacter incanus]|uniref:Uncharacterized protein n=1 Tax=Rarobacter incanus TaxID=153494 RepID=A0A542SQX0_9MICO|nr:hypothetical protein [Rarobacter incanus]TQK77013.1 hypothetical protein FB389_1721 [Rarobacter incanus]